VRRCDRHAMNEFEIIVPQCRTGLREKQDVTETEAGNGNLEYTPGKNVALSHNDWADALVGDLPHFYYYTTGNVGEGIIAKRRTHAVLVTHLTPPYVESGMRQRYTSLLEDIHKILSEDTEKNRTLGIRIKKEVIA
jgi:cobaltochelatase CobN